MDRLNRRIEAIPLLGLVGLALVSCLAGCPGLAPSDLPAELSHVVADPETFRQISDNGADGVPAELPGGELCLGAFSETCPPSGGVCQRLWQALHLDPATQQLTRYTADSLFGTFLLVDIWHGQYTELEPGHLRFEVRRVESNFPAGSPFSDITAKYDPLPVYDVYLTEADQGLRIEFRMPADDVRTPAGFSDNTALVHRMFECPD